MPQSTALPPPRYDYVSRYENPDANTLIGQTFAANDGSASGKGGCSVDAGPSSTGGAATANVALHLGRVCINIFGGASGVSRSVRFAYAQPAYQDVFNPGARLLPSSVVGVYDHHICMGTLDVGSQATPDSSGVWFLPDGTTPFNQLPPGGALSGGGFGVFANADGAGGTLYEYVSWDAGGGILERVGVPATAVPNPLNWSTVRFIIISAAGGRVATLTVRCNNVDVVVDREFGGPLLNPPTGSLNVPSWNVGFSHLTAGVGGRSIFWAMSCAWGPFLPDGRELQGP